MAYPILFGQTKEFNRARREGLEYPQSVPNSLVEGKEERAQKNHSQSLSRLAERGGLSPAELWCIVHNKGIEEIMYGRITEEMAIEWLRTIEGVSWRKP